MPRPDANFTQNELIMGAIQDFSNRLSDNYVTRREQSDFSGNLNATLARIEATIRELAQSVQTNYTTRREFEESVRQSQAQVGQLRHDFDNMEREFRAASNQVNNRFLGNASQNTYYVLMMVAAVVGGVAGHFIH